MFKHRLRGMNRHSREVWLLCAISALGSGAYLGIHQLLSALFVLRLGYGPETVGTLSATGAMSFSAASVLGGMLGVRLGSRRMMTLGVGIFVLGMSLLPLAGLIPAPWRLTWLMGQQVVTSSGWSMQVVSVISTLAAYTTVENRRSAYAMREASAGMGMLLGAAIGGILPGAIAGITGATTGSPAPYAMALWVSVAVGALGLIPMRLVPPVKTAARAAGPHVPFRFERSLVLLIASGFSINAAHSACKTFASVYLDTVYLLPTSLIGAVTSAGMALSVIAALSSTRLARRRTGSQMMLTGALGIAASLLLMALVRHPMGAVVGIVGVYGTLGLWRPAYQALQMEACRPEYRPLMSGASATGMSLGFGAMGFGGGLIVATAGYPPVFIAGALFAGLSATVAVLLARSVKALPSER